MNSLQFFLYSKIILKYLFNSNNKFQKLFMYNNLVMTFLVERLSKNTKVSRFLCCHIPSGLAFRKFFLFTFYSHIILVFFFFVCVLKFDMSSLINSRKFWQYKVHYFFFTSLIIKQQHKKKHFFRAK